MRFTQSHEWIKLDGDIGTVGITDHAQHELGDIVYVELPTLNSKVKIEGEVAVLESTKAAADIYSPVSGEIVAVNDQLKDEPELINNDPESLGWIYRIKLSNPSEYEALLDAVAYRAMLHGRI